MKEIVGVRAVPLKDKPGVHGTHITYADGRATRGADVRTVPREFAFQNIEPKKPGPLELFLRRLIDGLRIR